MYYNPETGVFRVSDWERQHGVDPCYAAHEEELARYFDFVEEKYPRLYNAVTFVQAVYGDYGDERVLNKHLHEVYDMANRPEKYYRAARIPKRGGGVRELSVPAPGLMRVQRWILNRLLKLTPVSEYACAYAAGKSTLANARPHVGKRMLVKLDISDFFPSIRFPVVYRNVLPDFSGQPGFYQEDVRTLVASLCCLRGALPQGAPTSPYLSNLAMRQFDASCAAYAAAFHLAYTRYSDDMTFSSSEEFSAGRLISFVSGALRPLGMTLNQNKIRVVGEGQRQMVTGLVVNAHLSAPKECRRKIRQEMYYLQKYGVERHLWALKYRGELAEDVTAKSYYNMLLGRIGYALSANLREEELKAYRSTLLGYLAEMRTDPPAP